jgi:fructokinase
MTNAIGLDIGGTKIAGAVFNAQGVEVLQITLPTPDTYEDFIRACRMLVEQLENKTSRATSLGACAPYADASTCANMPMLIGKNLQRDLEYILEREVPLTNDANCAALAEANEGAGRGYTSLFGLIVGTGIGGGFIVNGQIMSGANGLCGEIGHLPLPYYEKTDGECILCGCGQKGCIEKLLAGAALSRLYRDITNSVADPREIAERAQNNDPDALRVLDRYYTVFAKAMVTILHSFDPEIITVSGGLNALPNMYEEVPKRWGRYAVAKNPMTKFVPATFGAIAGLRGAAWLGKNHAKSCG